MSHSTLLSPNDLLLSGLAKHSLKPGMNVPKMKLHAHSRFGESLELVNIQAAMIQSYQVEFLTILPLPDCISLMSVFYSSCRLYIFQTYLFKLYMQLVTCDHFKVV